MASASVSKTGAKWPSAPRSVSSSAPLPAPAPGLLIASPSAFGSRSLREERLLPLVHGPVSACSARLPLPSPYLGLGPTENGIGCHQGACGERWLRTSLPPTRPRPGDVKSELCARIAALRLAGTLAIWGVLAERHRITFSCLSKVPLSFSRSFPLVKNHRSPRTGLKITDLHRVKTLLLRRCDGHEPTFTWPVCSR